MNTETKPYTRLTSTSAVLLGHIKNMLQPKVIQLRPFEIQLAEQYVYNKHASFLLIVNNRSEYEEVQAWREVSSTAPLKHIVRVSTCHTLTTLRYSMILAAL